MSRKLKLPVARRADPETSWQAARSVSGVRESQQRVLETLERFGPLTDEGIYMLLSKRMSPSGARTRRKELVDLGLVRDSGQRGTTKSGRQTIKWELDDEAEPSEPASEEVRGDQGGHRPRQRGADRPSVATSQGRVLRWGNGGGDDRSGTGVR